jgi:O-acetyl-ADP-ribose deacetylase (regulator of RNase III)
MIHFTYGNMFERPAEVLVNAVNCVGVMGKGVALAFKKRYPKLHRAYRQACYNGQLLPGGVFPWKAPDGTLILNVATKDDWLHKSRYSYILDGLNATRMILLTLPGQRVHIPALGCGNGGLSWEIVRGMIQNALEDVDGDVWVFEPMQGEN